MSNDPFGVLDCHVKSRQGVSLPNGLNCPAAGNSLSLAGRLGIAALVLAWVAAIWRWHSAGIEIDQSHAVTVFQVVPEDSRLDRILRLLSISTFLVGGTFAALFGRGLRLSRIIVFLLVTMLFDAIFWCLVGYQGSDSWSTMLGSTSPFVYTMCLGVFLGLEAELWNRLRKVSLVIACGSAVLGLYYTFRLTSKGTFEGTNPTIEHLQIAFWFGLCALVLRKSSRWRDCLPAIAVLALCIPMAVLALSRSFSFLTIVALLVCLTLPLQSSGNLKLAKAFGVSVIAVMVLVSGMWLMFMFAPERLQALNDRLAQDTRSGQYAEFFEQISVVDLVTGLGPNATYTFGDRSDYEYIDNQFLFILFKFGVPMLAGYCAIVIWPGWRLICMRGRPPERLTGFVIVLWTLAGLGVSIFHSILINPQSLLAVLLAGRAYALAGAAGQPALGSVPSAPRLAPFGRTPDGGSSRLFATANKASVTQPLTSRAT